MKYFNNLKLVAVFREISNVLDIISGAMRIFIFALMIVQAVLMLKETSQNHKSETV